MGIELNTDMEDREIRIKLDYDTLNRTEMEKKEINKIIGSNDEKYKNKFIAIRRTKEREFIPGDYVLIKQQKEKNGLHSMN